MASIVLVSAACRAQAGKQVRFTLGDETSRIVFVGGGLIEQARFRGYIESRLLQAAPSSQPLSFRNLGWSGDSVLGDARTAGYQEPAGLERLLKETTQLQPSVIFVGYGLVESFEGEAGLGRFRQGYNALLDSLQRITPKLVLLSPTFHEDLGRPMKDPAAHNRDLEMYTAAVAAIAGERKLAFVDLYHPLVEFKRSHPGIQLTSNGITLNDSGYWLVAEEIQKQLGIRPERFKVDLQARDAGQFELQETPLPMPPAPKALRDAGITADNLPSLRVHGLSEGQWALIVDDREDTSADAREWEKGIALSFDPAQDAAEKLRQAIIRANEIFYRRSRPFNDHERHWTYISGDYALYDKELAEVEKHIDALRPPAAHECRLIRKELSKP
ncbi:MAG TPA: SGNH/GDSL hydrolase family protein [Tepidisphaeraceae bacterium]|nr:SGNH/GDSL hydrolase family protein [Tepidisphaeraceae bacterium]